MKSDTAQAAPIVLPAVSHVETLPDEIERLTILAKAEPNAGDETQRELLDALSIAWLAAERWRIERSDVRMREINQH